MELKIKSQFDKKIKNRLNEINQKLIESLSLQNSAPLNAIAKVQKELNTLKIPKFNLDSNELTQATENAVLLVAQQGWYLDYNMHVQWIWKLEKDLLSNKIAKVDQTLINYFEDNLDDIENTVISLSPTRAHIFKEAFKAHRREQYDLSIPVFLAQADGIAKDFSGHNFFLKSDKKPKTAIYVEKQKSDTLSFAFLAPLTKSTTISASERERNSDEDYLNRHMILHGESKDYGSKINSLKVISLVNYISMALSSINGET
jgi:hypothetical protein